MASSVLQTSTLDPLPDVLRTGLIAVASFGILSLVSSVSLFIYLTYRLCRWYYNGQLRDGANQFLLLIYNLVLADIQQAMAFALTSVYLAKNRIEVGTTTCWANGWFVSTGDLASGVFILAIALHTFLAVVKGRRASNKVFLLGIAAAWIFVYTMAIIGVGIDPKLYVRAGAWCWINHKYDNERLWLHYFWIFLCMFATVITYALIFLSLMAKSRSTSHTALGRDPTTLNKRAAKYMIIYPVVYVICTLPLAGGRMAAMTGVRVPYWWYCLAGSAITSCGWLDVLLYAVTRRVLIFSDNPPPLDDFALPSFRWHDGEGYWGTTTTVTGPLTSHNSWRRGRRSHLGRVTPHSHSLRTRHSDEDYFAAATEGVIATKTTVEVQTGPIRHHDHMPYAGSETSEFELHDKYDRSRSQ